MKGALLPGDSQKLGTASEDTALFFFFFGPGTTSPNKGICCWEGDNCFRSASTRCQHQCFLLEANVWLRRQCQAKYFSLHKNPFNFLIIWQTSPPPSPHPSVPGLPLALSASGWVSATSNIWAGRKVRWVLRFSNPQMLDCVQMNIPPV